jgi:hypothetical protein
LKISNVFFSIFVSADKDEKILFDQDILNIILCWTIVEDVFNNPLRDEGEPVCLEKVRVLMWKDRALARTSPISTFIGYRKLTCWVYSKSQ